MSERNTALKSAIFDSPLRTQRKVAEKTRIPETRLSSIVNGRDDATPWEKKQLSKVLDLPIEHLFPEAIAS